MDIVSVSLVLLLVLVLTVINAFFVAAEMAIARVRRTRIDELAEEGSLAAKKVQLYLDDPNTFFSGGQLGITLAMLILGALGERFFAENLSHSFATLAQSMGWHSDMVMTAKISIYVLVFSFTAFFQTIVGELLPKSLTFQRAETVMLLTIYPMHFWCMLCKPLLFFMNKTMELIIGVFKIPDPPVNFLVHSEEELRKIVSASQEQGVLELEEEEMLHSVFEFADTSAHEIMTPRRDMICLEASKTVKDLVDLAVDSGHSRIPLYEEDVDSVFGFVHIRDGLKAFVEGKQNMPVRDLARRVLIVPENKMLSELLTEFKLTKTHMAIVVDEHGGTEGMVTFEDLLEELVGDIADEHDVVEEMITPNPDGTITVDARIDLESFNEKLGLDIEDEQFTTLGGHVFGRIGHEPTIGDEVNTEVYTLTIEEADRHRITKLRLTLHSPSPENGDSEDSETSLNGGPPSNETIEKNDTRASESLSHRSHREAS